MLHFSSLRKNRSGQALIESALSLSVVLVLLLGSIDFGRLMFLHQSIAHVARTSLRTMSVQTYDATSTPTQIQNLILFDSTTVPTGVTNVDSGRYGLVRSNISVSASITGTPDDSISVTISGYQFSFMSLKYVLPTTSSSLTSKSIVVSVPYEVPAS